MRLMLGLVLIAAIPLLLPLLPQPKEQPSPEQTLVNTNGTPVNITATNSPPKPAGQVKVPDEKR